MLRDEALDAGAQSASGSEPVGLTATELLRLTRDCGADDCGLVSIDEPLLAEELPHVAQAFPGTRSLLALVIRMHREPVRSPARSVANLEFHRAGHEVDEVARRIVRRLEGMGVRALNPAMAFPMELDNFPERGWIVSHKRVAETAGLGRLGIHRSLIHPRYGSFVLLGTVLIAQDFDAPSQLLDFNPCVECKLCVAACPVGAIKADGYFDDMGWVRLCRLRHRYLCSADRRLAGQQNGACRLRAGCPGAGHSRAPPCPSRRPNPSQRSRQPISLDQVHRAPGRSRDRAVGWQRR